MPVSFLTAEQERRYGRYAGEPSTDQLARHFHLDDADREVISAKRWDHMRLGFAVQLGTVRFLGTFLDEPDDVPPGVAADLARQLDIADPSCLARYAVGRARWQHAREIREQHGYREFTDPFARFRLARWLYALCWTGTDRPSVLFDRATAWLVTEKVLLPGASVLERLIARVRARAGRRLWRALARDVTREQRDQLDALLVAGEAGRPSLLDRLRDGPYLRSGAELSRAVARLDEVRLLAVGLPSVAHVPPGRVTALARFATVAKAQAVARLPEERRTATLLAFVRTLEASAQDDVLDLFDIVVTKLFTDAAAIGKRARLRTIRDLDAAALRLRRAGGVLMDDTIEDGAVREAAFAIVPRAAMAEALEKIDAIVRPPGDLYFTELRAQHGKLRFMPGLLRSVFLGATPAGRPVLDAVHHLRTAGGPTPSAPLGFVPMGWKRQVVARDGGIDALGYRLCLLESMRTAIRRRDLYASPSLRYADPRLGLLAGPAWEAARPAICRTLGLSTDAGAEIGRLSERLDTTYRATAANLPENASVQVEGDELVLSALDKLDEPPSLVALRAAVEVRMPRVDLPELLLELHARTGFASGFTHASEGGARAGDVATSICAVLLAEACNTGFEPLIRLDTPALRRSRLSWVRQNYIRAETLTRANAALVTAQNRPTGAPLGRRRCGVGRRASVCRARAHDPFGAEPALLRPGARGHVLQPGFRSVHRPERHRRAGHAARQLGAAVGRAGATDRTAADRDHDGHGRLYRYDLRYLPPTRLSVQPPPGRHRRQPILAREWQSQLRRAGRSGRAAHQRRADRPALGGSAAPGRIAQARHRAGRGPARGPARVPARCKRRITRP
jgi:Domain of unknown function (DUF4158)/Tn3 transposase DDE domain